MEVVESGYSTALAVALARVGWRARSWPRKPVRAAASAAPIALVPALTEIVLLVVQPAYALRTVQAIGWVVSLAVVNLFALLAGWRIWALFDRAAAPTAEMLATAAERDRIVTWLAAVLSRPRQITVSLLFAGTACTLLGLTHSAIQARLELGVISYLSVAWSGFICGNCIYWAFALSQFGRLALRRRDLDLVWHSPASTPAIMRLSEMYGALTLFILLAFLALQFLNLRASRYGESPVLTALSTVIPIGAAISSLATGLIPHLWLYATVREARSAALAVLRINTGGAPPASPGEAAQRQAYVELYRLVETSPGLPFSTASMVQYGAAILGTLLAYLLRT